MKAILKTLRAEAKGLNFLSESDSPVVAIHLSDSEVTALDKTNPLAPSEFFAPMTTPQPWHDEDERESVLRFQKLVSTLETLDGAMAFRQGSGPVADVVVVGKAPRGEYVGVRLRVTET